jgi:hypothetical protein
MAEKGALKGRGQGRSPSPSIKILEVGIVGSLDYKIIEAGRADDLLQMAQGQQIQLLRR